MLKQLFHFPLSLFFFCRISPSLEIEYGDWKKVPFGENGKELFFLLNFSENDGAGTKIEGIIINPI